MSDDPKAPKANEAAHPLVNKARANLVEPLEEHEVVAVASTHNGGPR
jgi:hypothetical protein